MNGGAGSIDIQLMFNKDLQSLYNDKNDDKNVYAYFCFCAHTVLCIWTCWLPAAIATWFWMAEDGWMGGFKAGSQWLSFTHLCLRFLSISDKLGSELLYLWDWKCQIRLSPAVGVLGLWQSIPPEPQFVFSGQASLHCTATCYGDKRKKRNKKANKTTQRWTKYTSVVRQKTSIRWNTEVNSPASLGERHRERERWWWAPGESRQLAALCIPSSS